MKLANPLIKLTPEDSKEIINKASRCTEATLAAFGIQGIPKFGPGILDYFKNNGFRTDRLVSKEIEVVRHLKALKGDWLIFTRGHAIALRNGILVDTERRGFDSRHVEFIWKITIDPYQGIYAPDANYAPTTDSQQSKPTVKGVR